MNQTLDNYVGFCELSTVNRITSESVKSLIIHLQISNIVFSFIIKGKNSVYLDIFSNDDLEAYAPEAII